jgi:hypothetical protein
MMAKETTVFLGSTFEDLAEHRSAVLEILARFKRQVMPMEYFGARSAAPLEVCLSEVSKAGTYIGIIGTRYGSIARDDKSFTQMEYEEAFQHKKNILIYLIDEEQHPVLPKHVDKGIDALRLSQFKELLRSRHTWKSFRSPDHLAGQVIASLITLFDDIGENVRAALEKDFSHILVEAGFLFSSGVDLMVSLKPDGTALGGFRFTDKNLEAVMAAAFLAQTLRNGNFEVLSHFVTLRHETWEALIFFLRRGGLNEEALATEIKNCDDSLQLRLLIKLAGELRATPCAEAICKRLFDSIQHHKIIQEFQIAVTPFNKTVEEALRQMPQSTRPVIEKYVDLARHHKKWQAKRTLESSLKHGERGE